MPDLTIKTVPIESLTPDPENARIHNERNLEAIAHSLSTFGQRRPIVVWQGVVIAGNGTIEAAKSLGWSEVAIAETPDDWTEDKARAYALADNRTAELAAWDEGVLGAQLSALDAAEWDTAALGFSDLSREARKEAPSEFPSVDEGLDTEYRCPSCAYEWSGSPRPGSPTHDEG